MKHKQDSWQDFSQDFSLGGDFPSRGVDTWRTAIEKNLKGRKFEDAFVSRLREGIAVDPVYFAAPDSKEDRLGVGALMPGWHPANLCVRVLCANPDLEAARRDLGRDLAGGATSLALITRRHGATAGHDDPSVEAGVPIRDGNDLARLLGAVDLSAITLALDAGGAFLPVTALVRAHYHHAGIEAKHIAVEANADPLAAWIEEGCLSAGVDKSLSDMADLALSFASTLPRSRSVGVNSAPYSRAGANAAQELACLIATGLTYIKAMVTRGLSLSAATGQMAFTLSAESDIFLTIAKFRAARILWARIVTAAGGTKAAAHMTLHGATAQRMITRHDPWVNMLRSTAAAFGAGVGGAETLTVHSFDSALGTNSETARRVARNIPTILREESGIAHVRDPADGSWYMESLTRRLAEVAWQQFQWIEDQGGMETALRSGRLLEQVTTAREQLKADIACGRLALTGVSTFPDLHERAAAEHASLSEPTPDNTADTKDTKTKMHQAPPTKKVDHSTGEDIVKPSDDNRVEAILRAARRGVPLAALSQALAAKNPQKQAQVKNSQVTNSQVTHAQGTDHITPWPRYRLAEDFEALRDASDRYVAQHGRRPSLFLVLLGTKSAHGAARVFATNFFATGGVDVIVDKTPQDDPVTPARAATQFHDSGCHVACLCGDDETYAKMGADFTASLKKAGAQEVYLIGESTSTPDNNGTAPVAIGAGRDALNILKSLHQHLGVT